MADNRINEFSSLINQQIKSLEIFNEYISKAEAILHLALQEDFLDNPKSVIHDCLWLLSDLVVQARQLNSVALDVLLGSVREN